MRARNFIFSTVMLAVVMTTAANANAADTAEDEEKIATYAVQNRKYRMGHELHAGFGVLPMNAFTKGLTLGGGYTYHFTDHFAWEVGQFLWSFGIDTDLKRELLNNFGAQPTNIESLQYLGSSNLVIKPLYGKSALFNRRLVHSEFFLVVGGGFAHYINPSAFRGGFDVGMGFRLHVVKHLSFRLDVRDYVFFRGRKPVNELHLAVSIAVSFGR